MPCARRSPRRNSVFAMRNSMGSSTLRLASRPPERDDSLAGSQRYRSRQVLDAESRKIGLEALRQWRRRVLARLESVGSFANAIASRASSREARHGRRAERYLEEGR